MAVFVYSYKTSAGERLSGEINASSRDEAFAELRTKGIRPIKVTAKDEISPERKRLRRRLLGAGVLLAMSIVGVIAYWGGRRSTGDVEVVIDTPSGPVTSQVATALARQWIPGDPVRLVNLPTNLFAYAAEFHLAKFAEPGKTVNVKVEDISALEQSFKECLKQPIRCYSNEHSEYIDLKRIVTGMKRELEKYLHDGGTVTEYLGELVKRQRLEVSYREKAAEKLKELESSPEQAYAYWLKANARLKSMGIEELPLPDTLRSCQLNLDFDE